MPAPTSVTLDLAGCIGCLLLKNDPVHGQVHVYLSGIHVTGLEAAYSSSNGSSCTQGTPLALPLWAYPLNLQCQCDPAQCDPDAATSGVPAAACRPARCCGGRGRGACCCGGRAGAGSGSGVGQQQPLATGAVVEEFGLYLEVRINTPPKKTSANVDRQMTMPC